MASTPRRRSRFKILRTTVGGLGVSASLRYFWHHTFGRGPTGEYSVRPRRIAHPLIVRRGASDIHAFKLIFIDREYTCLDNLPNVRLVLDCGANVGYSSAYFLSVFPDCKVVAVEPESGNFNMLQRNLAPYGDRAKCIRAGVWSHSAPLAISRETYREGSEWSKQVRICKPGEQPEFEGIDIATLLETSGSDRISLLKMDVEGAEAIIFSENYEGWLDRVETIAIELHDDSSFGPGSDVFFAALKGRNFRISTSAELTICRQSL